MAKPGAPMGNRNALKHGLYAKTLSHRDLDSVSLSSLSLLPEISLLRSLLDSFFQSSDSDFFDINVIDTVSAICLRLASIAKSHSLISGLSSDDLVDAITTSINSLMDNG